MEETGSLTRLGADLRSADLAVRDEASRRIWEEYSGRLAMMARGRIARRIAAREDEEDVLQSAFKSFVMGQAGAGPIFANRDEIWRRLVLITMRKVATMANRHTAARRDVRREGASLDEADECGSPAPGWALELMDRSSPGPAEVAVLEEELELLLRPLGEDQRAVAMLRMQGYTNEEIAGKINRAITTVELKFQIIRERLRSRLEEIRVEDL